MNKFNFLGLARRSNNLIIGSDEIIKNSSQIKLVIMFDNISLNMQKKINQKNLQIVVVTKQNAENIQKATGLENVKILGLTDSGFANKVLQYIR